MAAYGAPGAPKVYPVCPDSLPDEFKKRAYAESAPTPSPIAPRRLATIRAKLPVRASAKCTQPMAAADSAAAPRPSRTPTAAAGSSPMAAANNALALPGSHAFAGNAPMHGQNVYAILGQALATAEPSLFKAASDPHVQMMLQDQGQAKKLWKSFLEQQASPPRRRESLGEGDFATPMASGAKRARTCSDLESSAPAVEATPSAGHPAKPAGEAMPSAGHPAQPKAGKQQRGLSVDEMLKHFGRGADADCKEGESDDESDDDTDGQAREPKVCMKVSMKARKAMKARTVAKKPAKKSTAPAQVSRTASATSKMGDKSAASLRYKSGKREVFWYGVSRVYTVWKNGKGRYRVYQKPGDKVEVNCGFSTKEKSRQAWEKATKLLVRLNGKPRA